MRMVTRPVIASMASTIRIICLNVRDVKCGLSGVSIAMISFMVGLDGKCFFKPVFYLF